MGRTMVNYKIITLSATWIQFLFGGDEYGSGDCSVLWQDQPPPPCSLPVILMKGVFKCIC